MKNKKLLAGIIIALLLILAVLLLLLGGEKPVKPAPQTAQTTTLGETETQGGEKETAESGEEQTITAGGNEETKPTEGDKETDPTEGDEGTKPTEGSEETKSTEGDKETQPTEGDKETQPQETMPLPEELPPTVTIPPETDPESGEQVGIQFPCQVPGYDLVVEKLAPYSGMFVEDGSNANVSDVAMIMVKNQGDYPIEYTQITVEYADQTLSFYISALPVGGRMVVQEKEGKKVPNGEALSATAMVVRRADMEMSEGVISVTDNGDNTLTVENLTDKTIPTVRVFYKYYMEDEDIYVGGIAFTLRLTRLPPHAKRTVQPSHFTSAYSRVVMVLTYDEEV